jgi:hypothetical protein
MLSRTSIGDEKPTQYSLVETLNKKWPKNESNSEDDKYELPILKCGANQCALVKQKKRTLEWEEEPITPFKSRKYLESKDEKSFGSCSGVNVNSWHRMEGGSPSYV